MRKLYCIHSPKLLLSFCTLFASQVLTEAESTVSAILTDILHPFRTISCTVFVRNYQNLDYVAPTIPITVQTIRPFILVANGFERYPFWYPATANTIHQKSINVSGLNWCSSYYMSVIEYSRTEIQCTTINMGKWTVASRPWQWTILIDLFLPSNYIQELLPYPYSEELRPMYPPIRSFGRSEIPQLNFLVKQYPLKDTEYIDKLVTRWMILTANIFSEYSLGDKYLNHYFSMSKYIRTN